MNERVWLGFTKTSFAKTICGLALSSSIVGFFQPLHGRKVLIILGKIEYIYLKDRHKSFDREEDEKSDTGPDELKQNFRNHVAQSLSFR